MTSQGSPRSRFARAVKSRNAFLAEVALREMGNPTLLEALDYLSLLAEGKAPRYERAALRWHGRLELENPTLSMAESRFALAVLERLKADARGYEMLKGLLHKASPLNVHRIR